MWVLRIELGPSPGAASTLNCWTVISIPGLPADFCHPSARLHSPPPPLLPFLCKVSLHSTRLICSPQFCLYPSSAGFPGMCYHPMYVWYVRSHYTRNHTMYVVALLVRISLLSESPIYSFAQPSQGVYQVSPCRHGTPQRHLPHSQFINYFDGECLWICGNCVNVLCLVFGMHAEGTHLLASSTAPAVCIRTVKPYPTLKKKNNLTWLKISWLSAGMFSWKYTFYTVWYF